MKTISLLLIIFFYTLCVNAQIGEQSVYLEKIKNSEKDGSVNKSQIIKKAFNKIVNKDIGTLSGINSTPQNQLVINPSEKSVEINSMFRTEKDTARSLIRIGFRLKGKLDDEVFPIFSGKSKNTNPALEVGAKLMIDLFAKTKDSRYFFLDDAAINSFIAGRNVLNARLNEEKRVIEATIATLKIATPLNIDDTNIIAFKVDSLENVLKKWTQTSNEKKIAYDINAKWSKKKYAWVLLEHNYTNTKTSVFPSIDAADGDDFIDKINFNGSKNSVSINLLQIHSQRKYFPVFFASGKLDYLRKNSIFDLDKVKIQEITPLILPKGTSVNREEEVYDIKEDVKVNGVTTSYKQSDLKLNETISLSATGLVFFTKDRDFGLVGSLTRNFKLNIKEQYTDVNVGLVIPAVKDDKENTKMNIVLEFQFLDINKEREKNIDTSLKDRWGINLKLAIPLKLPEI